jgi:hypothetical protein
MKEKLEKAKVNIRTAKCKMRTPMPSQEGGNTYRTLFLFFRVREIGNAFNEWETIIHFKGEQ